MGVFYIFVLFVTLQYRNVPEKLSVNIMFRKKTEEADEVSTFKLKKFLSRIETEGEMTDGDVVKLVSLTRQLIEKKKLKSKYQLLNFYCNWCFHTELSALDPNDWTA